MPERKRIVLLGATGSIGSSTLRVLDAHPDRLELVGIAANRNIGALEAIARKYQVRHIGLFDSDAAASARSNDRFGSEARIYSGLDGICDLATLEGANIVVVAVVGTASLRPTLAAIEAGKTIALANKEILVMAGDFVTRAAREYDVDILPLDSEHNAIYQCLQGSSGRDVRRILLTASGGAFLDRPMDTLNQVTPEEALKHPNWSMGPKVTVDSATMANKGLELIEAHWLFGLPSEAIDVVIHRQSIVHSMVEYVDGSILAQLSPPSMTFAIQHSLLHPNRAPATSPGLDFSERMQLGFEPPDHDRFPCLSLARQALEAGGVMPAVYNAANEIAVGAFLEQRVGFLEIPSIINSTLQKVANEAPTCLEDVLTADHLAREVAGQWAHGQT